MATERFLGGRFEEVPLGPALWPVVSPAILAQSFLWFFQSAFWQSREQYHCVLHLAQRFKSDVEPDLWQTLQEFSDMIDRNESRTGLRVYIGFSTNSNNNNEDQVGYSQN